MANFKTKKIKPVVKSKKTKQTVKIKTAKKVIKNTVRKSIKKSIFIKKHISIKKIIKPKKDQKKRIQTKKQIIKQQKTVLLKPKIVSNIISNDKDLSIKEGDPLEIKETLKTEVLEKLVKTSYLDYAMSVIVSRALPDIRDGLKPVHRRVLYAMYEIGLRHNVKYRKSATVIGAVLGKYHPHSDQAVYDSLVRMAQSFSLRYPLIDGQGNFGSVDGDSAAAYRYTECRLSAIAEELLSDIEKETVLFSPNYDGTTKEPQVLPAKLPCLLLNGSMGIAVGMATNIPPHNLGELCDAIIYLIDHPKAEINDLFQFVKGPDFPTGGFIFDANQIKQVYAVGKGPIVMRSKTEIIEKTTGKFQILITELPYQVNKATLLQKVADLVKNKKLEGIKDIRDESGKEGIRIMVELKKNTYPQKTLNRLFKLTDLQQVFHVNMVSLLDGIQPKIFGLKGVLDEYIRHRQEVVRKRTAYDLAKTKARIHILEGLQIAMDHIDAIIKLIKKSKDKEEARRNLIKKYKLTEIQSDAILEMRLHQLANIERNKVKDELKQKKLQAKDLKGILDNPKKVFKIIQNELEVLKEKFGDPRRTKVVPNPIGKFKEEDLVPNEPTVIITTRDGYIKRLPPDSFKTQGRGGKGVVGLNIKEEDQVDQLIAINTHADILFFTTKGKVFQLKAYDIPQVSRTSRGQALVNFLELASSEKVSAILPVDDLKNYHHLVMSTKKGIIKKVQIDAFSHVRRSGLIAIKLKDDDTLDWVKPSTGKDEILLASRQGQSIHFKETDLRSMGRGAAGVFGMRLKKNDEIIGMGVSSKATNKKEIKLLVVSEKGYGKMTPLVEYRIQKRSGSGIKTAKVSDKTGQLVAARIIALNKLPEWFEGDLLVISSAGQVIRTPLKTIPTMGRSTQGVRLMRFKKENDQIASFALI